MPQFSCAVYFGGILSGYRKCKSGTLQELLPCLEKSKCVGFVIAIITSVLDVTVAKLNGS